MPPATPLPIPTPYDITPIPVVPWSPGSTAWIVTLTVLAALFLLLRGYQRFHAKRTFDAGEILLAELRQINPERSLDERQRLIKLTQRALNFLRNCDVRGLSSEELLTLSTQEERASERNLLSLLAELENDQYAPPDSQGNAVTIEHAQRLYAAVQSLILERERS